MGSPRGLYSRGLYPLRTLGRLSKGSVLCGHTPLIVATWWLTMVHLTDSDPALSPLQGAGNDHEVRLTTI